MTLPQLHPLDPFDLPDWLGTDEVSWTGSILGCAPGDAVNGELSGTEDHRLGCDLLAVDQAYPAPVVTEDVRRHAHQSWQHGQVLVVSRGGRTTVATPGTEYSLQTALETVTRLARAVGADPARWSVRLALGGA